MKGLLDLCRYNAWANRRMFDACAHVATDRRAMRGEGLTRTLGDLLTHLVAVEDGYLRLIGGPTLGPRPADFEGLRERSLALGQAYVRHLESLEEAGLDRTFYVEWFKRDLTVWQGILQVVTHSIQHRADIATALTQLGGEPPALDYVVFLADPAAAPSTG